MTALKHTPLPLTPTSVLHAVRAVSTSAQIRETSTKGAVTEGLSATFAHANPALTDQGCARGNLIDQTCQRTRPKMTWELQIRSFRTRAPLWGASIMYQFPA